MAMGDGKFATEDVCADKAVRTPGKLYFICKRCFDVIFSLLALILLLPLFLLVAFMIHHADGGSVIYRRRCVSAKGDYDMLKFRTMVMDAHDLEKYLTPEQIEEYRANIKLEGDPRITKIGNFLRRTSIDELPQLINVLRGEMSFVGPRPVVAEELEYFGENKELLLSAKPGITGYWQVNGRSNCSYLTGERQELEIWYVRHRSLWLDLTILVKTIPAVLSSKGAH